TPLEHPLRLFLASRDEADHVLTESGRQGVGFDVGMETGSVFRLDQVLDFLSHGITTISQPAWIYLAAFSVILQYLCGYYANSCGELRFQRVRSWFANLCWLALGSLSWRARIGWVSSRETRSARFIVIRASLSRALRSVQR